MGRMKVQDLQRPDVAALMKKLAYKQAEANRTFGVLSKMFNLAEVWGLRPDGHRHCQLERANQGGHEAHRSQDSGDVYALCSSRTSRYGMRPNWRRIGA